VKKKFHSKKINFFSKAAEIDGRIMQTPADARAPLREEAWAGPENMHAPARDALRQLGHLQSESRTSCCFGCCLRDSD
jgi:hypothetical protein